MVNRVFKCLFITLLLMTTYGCSMVFVGFDKDRFVKDEWEKADANERIGRVYTRTQVDLRCICFPFRAFLGKINKDGDNTNAKIYAVFYGPFCVLFGAVDLPLAIVWDTVTLPFDLLHRNED